MTYIHYGCGHHAPSGWQNYDSSPTIVLERIPVLSRLYSKNPVRFPANVRRANIVTGLPVPPGSADGVYCSHTLEHLALDEFRAALRNTLVMLKPGGLFRFVLPDLEALARHYLASEVPTAAHTFMLDSMLGVPTRSRGFTAIFKHWLGGSEHLWMWDYRSMHHELTAAGFNAIRRASFGDSADPQFTEVEDIGRWTGCLGVECRKPAKSGQLQS